ncbi:DUF5677 domain-containing protein [Mesorhizobium sp.]|uniref:DUF5677 domain-containing protein n=1 Tax=Mesorhizobium sp. TaxID=1871066 RepID=UPI000FE38869|nr:DUF5677 domain-containing protein [Mesorhizobium sp.]RWG78560.1 MAG: hypothetical protein EOQ70_30580 [Mesorhizobium sp.]RWK22556.1 MAG: hypothetical protein EOR41_00170 [Mesorhizobium sp.]
MHDEYGVDGFLSEEPLPLEAEIVRAHREVFALARRVNRECHKLIFGTDVRNRDGKAMLVASLFLRALQHYQSAVWLLQKGMIAAAKAAIRIELEAVFAVRAIAVSEENYRAYVNDDLLQRYKLMNKARMNDYPALGALRDSIGDGKQIGELKQKIADAGIKPILTEEWSKRAEMHDVYLSVYALLSYAIHSNVRELDAYLTLGPDSEVQEIEYAPSLDEIPDLVLIAADFIVMGSAAVERQFEINFADLRHELSAAIQAGMDTNAPPE